MNARADNTTSYALLSQQLGGGLFRMLLSLSLATVMAAMPLAGWANHTARAAAPSAPGQNCQPFTQINISAFGLGPGAEPGFANEQSFEVIVFGGRVYLGMEADDSLGARLWRTNPAGKLPKNQRQWQEVAVSNGKPFGVSDLSAVDHVDSLAEFQGYLYVSTASDEGVSAGMRIFRSPTGNRGSWEDAMPGLTPGFGDVNNVSFSDMQVFENWLCGGTRNAVTGAQVWCSQDGLTWALKSFGGLGDMVDIPENAAITSGYVYNRGLYFSVQNVGTNPDDGTDDVTVLYRTTDLHGEPTWQEVFRSEVASSQMTILGEFQGALYVAYTSKHGIRIMRSFGGNPNTWEQVSPDGMNHEAGNRASSVDGAVVYNDSLYLSISNEGLGMQLWRTLGEKGDGGSMLAWEAVNSDGLGDANNISAQLIVFEGALLAWTTNPQTGQQVRQTVCSVQGYDSK